MCGHDQPMSTRYWNLRGILRIEWDDGQPFFSFYHRQKVELEDLNVLLELEFPEDKSKHRLVELIDFHCTYAYYFSNWWGEEDDDMWLEIHRLKVLKRYQLRSYESYRTKEISHV